MLFPTQDPDLGPGLKSSSQQEPAGTTNGSRAVDMKKRNQAGQVLIEYILLMVVLVGILGTVTTFFRNQKTFSTLTNAIWAGVAQMAERGSWPSAGAPIHPNSFDRARTLDPN